VGASPIAIYIGGIKMLDKTHPYSDWCACDQCTELWNRALFGELTKEDKKFLKVSTKKKDQRARRMHNQKEK
jgi:hypothetical protein